MAEARDPEGKRDTLPQSGNVNKVCKQWLVHEDGAFAYKVQEEEFDHHYGLNRFNRRTVREDIPVAKVVHSEEEKRLQEERLAELEALKAQAEEDEKIARRVMEDLKDQEVARQQSIEIQDEELAREVQEREKRKYEKYKEKKKERHLQKEREKIEKELEKHTHEARIAMGSEPGHVERLGNAVENISLQQSAAPSSRVNGNLRVTPSGRIEDDGDFSDFYVMPSIHLDDGQKRQLQELQDEELARLIQEQEHKRTKAEVDRTKFREIEEQDQRLAQIIQEQEKLKVRKVKQKRQQMKQRQEDHDEQVREAQRKQAAERAKSHDFHKLRRDSFLQSLGNGPAGNGPVSPTSPDRESRTSSQLDSRTPSHPDSRTPSQPDSRTPSQPDSQRALPPPPTNRPRLPSPDELPPNSTGEVERWLARSPAESNHSQISQPRSRSDHSEPLPPSPSPPGSYHSDEELPYRAAPNLQHGGDPCYAISSPMNAQGTFNIATAIDPTYNRRQRADQSDETERKMPASPAPSGPSPLALSRSLPVADDELEWDPGLRGSLRRPRGTWNPMLPSYQDGTMSRDDSFPEDGPVLSPWQPVQGQKRSTIDRNRKPKKPLSPSTKRSSCKQQ